LAKILAAYTVFLAALGLTFVFPFVLFITEHASISGILLGYLGFALFGLSVITLGVFISSLSEHPIRAGIVTIISLLILWMEDNILPNISNPTLHGLLSVFSLFGKLLDFQYNFLRFSSIAYMVSFSVIFLLLTCKSVDLRRANKV
jgi:ABC-2 type transport system permease protein